MECISYNLNLSSLSLGIARGEKLSYQLMFCCSDVESREEDPSLSFQYLALLLHDQNFFRKFDGLGFSRKARGEHHLESIVWRIDIP